MELYTVVYKNYKKNSVLFNLFKVSKNTKNLTIMHFGKVDYTARMTAFLGHLSQSSGIVSPKPPEVCSNMNMAWVATFRILYLGHDFQRC